MFVVVAHQHEPEGLEIWKRCVLSVDNMVASEHYRRRGGLLECSMQSKTLEIMGMSNSGQDYMRYPGVHEIEVGEVFYGHRLECRVPRVVEFEICSEYQMTQRVFVLVKNCPH